ncbi:MAG: hypothetical protein QOF27_395 [Gaiellaceae bacterium]|jgi:hypothetical protein|nr:hypothetical protein [Gaiellaceae bacterium]
MADFLTLRHNRDRVGKYEVPFRRAGTGLVTLFLVAGLLNVFGQRPQSSTAAVSAASIKVYAAAHVRLGLYFEARFTIDAHSDVKKATLVLDSGWAEGMTINTIEPSPIGEASRNGKLVFELGHIPAGKTYLLFMQLQVNPTNVGRRSQDVALYDGNTFLTSIDRTITVFP